MEYKDMKMGDLMYAALSSRAAHDAYCARIEEAVSSRYDAMPAWRDLLELTILSGLCVLLACGLLMWG
jgi:hypothetical protein